MPTITGLTDVDLNFDHLAECSGFFTVKLLFPSSLHTVPFGWSHYAQPTLKEWGVMLPEGRVSTYVIWNSPWEMWLLPPFLCI